VRSATAMAALLFVMGLLQTTCVASLNTLIQMSVHEGMRGRVMSMMTVILFGFATSGALIVGVIGHYTGVVDVLGAGGVVIALAAGSGLARARTTARAVVTVN
jgi:hypothetical protein